MATTYARWYAFVADQFGNVDPTGTIGVVNESDGLPPATGLWDDRAGTIALANPFTYNDANGYASFHVVGGLYRITITVGANVRILREVPIGTNSETDVNTPDDKAALLAQVFN